MFMESTIFPTKKDKNNVSPETVNRLERRTYLFTVRLKLTTTKIFSGTCTRDLVSVWSVFTTICPSQSVVQIDTVSLLFYLFLT